jgi:peroxiredoxin
VLGAFAKLRKVNISFVMSSVRKPFALEKLCSHWTNIHEILHLSIFRKSVEKIKVPLKHGKNNGYFTLRTIYISDHISLTSSSNEKCCKQTLKIKKHILCSVFFSSKIVLFMR